MPACRARDTDSEPEGGHMQPSRGFIARSGHGGLQVWSLEGHSASRGVQTDEVDTALLEEAAGRPGHRRPHGNHPQSAQDASLSSCGPRSGSLSATGRHCRPQGPSAPSRWGPGVRGWGSGGRPVSLPTLASAPGMGPVTVPLPEHRAHWQAGPEHKPCSSRRQDTSAPPAPELAGMTTRVYR